MRLFARILGIGFALVIALLLAAGYWISDANNLKPELAALIAENSDFTAEFKGDISWSLLPPLQLKIADLALTRSHEQIVISSMDLKMDLSAMWQDVDQWQVTQLYLADTVYRTTSEEGVSTTTIQNLTLQDFRPGFPAGFVTTAEHLAPASAKPVAATLTGTVTYHPATDKRSLGFTFQDTQVDTDIASGICQAEVSETDEVPSTLPAPQEDDLLPVGAMRTYDLTADCSLSDLSLGNKTFHQSTIKLSNTAGQAGILLNIDDFLGGSMRAEVQIDASQTPIPWIVTPQMQNVDSQLLLDWADQSLQWIAPVALNGSIRMYGNSASELAASMEAASTFDGGQGQLNIAAIKQQLMRIALLIRQTDEVANWPDVWNYQQFTGRWNMAGQAHDLTFAIDNMSVDAQGKYDYLDDALDFLANITVHPAPEDSPFRINPILEGTPIPIRCTGSSANPQCRLQEDAAQQLIARALRQDDKSGLRSKLEQKIDEEVPPEYRETARGILDLLGRSLEEN